MSLAILKKRDGTDAVGKPDASVRLIPTEDLNVDHRYQRNLRDAWVKTIAKSFDPRRIGTLTVVERTDGTFWVVDGAHRLSAMRLVGWTQARCEVLLAATFEDEAALFYQLNTARRAVNSWDTFRALVASGDKDAIRITEIVKEEGFTISKNFGAKFIRATAGLQRIYKMGGEDLLRDSLRAIETLWAGDPDATEVGPLVGTALFLKHYRPHPAFDPARLFKTLADVPVAHLRREVRALQGQRDGLVGGSGLDMKYLLVIRRRYNAGLRTRKLPLPLGTDGRVIGSYSE